MDIKSLNRTSAPASTLKSSSKKKKDDIKDGFEHSQKKDKSFKESMKETGSKIGKWLKDHIVGESADYRTRKKMNKMIGIGAAGGGAVGAVAGYAMGYMNESNDKVSEVWKSHDINNPEELTGWTHRDIEDGHYEAHHYYYYETVSHTGYNSDGSSYTYYTNEQQCYTYYTYEHDGYWHRNYPTIDWKTVGSYKTPHLVHENAIGPIAGAAIGLGAGVVGGGIIGAISAHIFKVAKQLKEKGEDG